MSNPVKVFKNNQSGIDKWIGARIDGKIDDFVRDKGPWLRVNCKIIS